MDLTLATCTDMPEPDADEQPLLEALHAAGIEVRLAAWDDPAVDWGVSPLTVVRSTWNYTDDRPGFLDWMRRVSSASTVLRNSLSVMAPNTHKGYLAMLERAGVPVVPTSWAARDPYAAPDADALRALPWERIVVKPAVGAGSRGVRVFDLGTDTELEDAARHVATLRRSSEVLTQPQLRSVVEHGEQDIVWIDGEVTHVVTKHARLEGDSERVAPTARPASEAELQLVRQTLRTIPQIEQREVLYARVDVAADELGTLRVIELELVEPSLFLIQHEPAMQRLVAALGRACGRERIASAQ